MKSVPIEGLVCPELDLFLFCSRVGDRDPFQVLDAAGMESSLLFREYHERTGRSTFRVGTRQRRYVEDLQRLVFLLLNGQYPSEGDDQFFLDVAAMVTRLLVKWKIGNLREVFSDEAINQRLDRESERNPLLRLVLRARESGKGAAEGLSGHGGTVGDVHGNATIHLAVRANSRVATELSGLSSKYPFLVRVNRGFSGGMVLTIHGMSGAVGVERQRAANDAALKVLQHELGIDGYVIDWEYD